ncbi:hypothetical protein [Flavobacterium sp. K5-23]|uniref:hypothetical protein n=1 Tax=Flavobacterium sp. K5-23 TaxID=2746225 RepID=UPI00200E1043|nr:hypothetical protein [Flavobacterium sp. K5-23]UQD57192.1 hypothetical protein FLAK523_12640 [Flavobacterium sp. K5-23]
MKKKALKIIRLLGINTILVLLLALNSGSAYAQPVNPFITTWQTDASKIVQIPLTGSGYDFTIDWGDGFSETKTGSPGTISRTYATAGTYTVTITPNTANGFPRIFLNSFANKANLMTISQWGGAKWTSMDRAFSGASALSITATDVPDLSLVTSFFSMFYGCTNLTNPGGSMNNWVFTTDVTKSITFEGMFWSC